MFMPASLWVALVKDAQAVSPMKAYFPAID